MTTNSFDLKISSDAIDRVIITVSGPIDETARFPDVKSEGQITVDLTKVTAINSVGIRAWCLWIQRVRAPAQLVLVGTPVVMAKNFSSIQGFLNDRCRVFSFVVPYYSEALGERQQIMATWGKHFDSSGLLVLPKIMDSQGSPMTIDAVEAQYFAFLHK
jgi:hypothetical protein